MATLSTYISFPGHTKEAFEHYRDVFGGTLDVMTYGQTAIEGMPMPEDAVAHAVLTLPGGTIAGGDSMPGETYSIRGSIYSLLYSLDDVEEGRRLIDALVQAGGTVGMPFEPAPWGGHYGQVFDRYGVMWSFSVDAAAA